MADISTESQKDEYYNDHLLVHHPDGNSEKISIPDEDEVILKIGRELDNDIVLTDPRASRHHAEVRRMGALIEVKDLGSANGILINDTKIEAETWTRITPKQEMKLAETRIMWEKAASSQSTVAMPVRPRRDTSPSVAAASGPAVAGAAPAPQPTTTQQSMLPWAIGGGVVVVILILLAMFFLFFSSGDGDTVAQTTPAPASSSAPTDDRSAGLGQQTTNVDPTATPTPSGPQLAIPVLEIVSMQVSPIIFGASPSTTDAYIYIDVRVRNAGNIPFLFSISNFSLEDRSSGQIFNEAGASISENYLKQLGAINRFENLALTPGGSVPGSLVYQLEVGTYDLNLLFEAPDIDPVVLGLGTTNMRRELDLAAGTPLAELDADLDPQTATPTTQPTPTATRPAEIPSPVVVARSAMAGTIAFPVFNGTNFDIYIGDVNTLETQFFRSQASQPAFNQDGSQIAFHSWDDASRGLMTMDVTGANPVLVTAFVEDQLPTWTQDGENIVLLTRRDGATRRSELIKVSASTERDEGVILGEGEYPTIGADGQMVFKGWGNTAFGLRLSNEDLSDAEAITNVEEDTAPSLSPDGESVVFMSRREGDWNIYTANVDGSNLQQLTTDTAEDGIPVWSPDGNAIAFVSNRGGVWAVWVMTPQGQGISQLFTLPGTPDGFVSDDPNVSRGWAEERISWTDQLLVQ